MDYKGFLKQINSTTLRLKVDGRNYTYKGYTIGDLPSKFGFKYDELEDTDGISSWFNFKGLTYILK